MIDVVNVVTRNMKNIKKMKYRWDQNKNKIKCIIIKREILKKIK